MIFIPTKYGWNKVVRVSYFSAMRTPSDKFLYVSACIFLIICWEADSAMLAISFIQSILVNSKSMMNIVTVSWIRCEEEWERDDSQ